MTAPAVDLLAACLEEPADDVVRLVYADLLRESDDPAVRTVGRFVWAGCTLARYRDPAVERDDLFTQAAVELANTGRPRIEYQAREICGWPADGFGWSNEYDRVTAVRFPGSVRAANLPRVKTLCEALVYARGFVHTARLTLARWPAVAGNLLAWCPLERVELIDVPGCTLAVRKWTDAHGTGWTLTAALDLPGTAGGAAAGALPPILQGIAYGSRRHHPPRHFALGTDPMSRRDLVATAALHTERLVAGLRDWAGTRWPGPPEDETT